MNGRILVIGSINTDLVTYTDRVPVGGETLVAQDFVILPGGKGANQAVAAARLGGDVAIIGRVGADAFGREALAGLAAEGISADLVQVTEGVPSGVATILVESSGENRILIVAGANGQVMPADVPDAALQGAALVVLQLEIPLATVADIIARSVALGVEVLLNPAPAASLDPAMLRGVRYLVPNRDELGRLAGLPVGRTDEVVAAARRLVRRGVGCVIVTLGEDGALLVTQERVAHVEAPRVTPVDTTGAGDAFIGCFAQTLVATGDVDAAVARAVRYAADSVTRRGAQISYQKSKDVLFL